MPKEYISHNSWDEGWHNYDNTKVIEPAFDPLLQAYLPVSAVGKKYTFIEIGSTPGVNLVYFAKKFSYDVTGIDFAGVDVTRKYLSKHNIQFKLINKDMFRWHTESQFDVVFSTGVVEHFDPISPVFDIHKKLCAPGGFVVICIPNIRYINKFIVDIASPGLSEKHNLKMMKPEILQGEFDGKFKILYCNYYKTSLIDIAPHYASNSHTSFFQKALKGFKKVSSILHLDNIPNRFLSPNIIIIAKKT